MIYLILYVINVIVYVINLLNLFLLVMQLCYLTGAADRWWAGGTWWRRAIAWPGPPPDRCTSPSEITSSTPQWNRCPPTPSAWPRYRSDSESETVFTFEFLPILLPLSLSTRNELRCFANTPVYFTNRINVAFFFQPPTPKILFMA